MARKATKNEVHDRINDVYKLLLDGYSRNQIALYAAENWGIKMRQVEDYLARARELQKLDSAIERPQWLLSALGRLQNYEMTAAKRGQFQAATRSSELQAKLLRFELT